MNSTIAKAPQVHFYMDSVLLNELSDKNHMKSYVKY